MYLQLFGTTFGTADDTVPTLSVRTGRYGVVASPSHSCLVRSLSEGINAQPAVTAQVLVSRRARSAPTGQL